MLPRSSRLWVCLSLLLLLQFVAGIQSPEIQRRQDDSSAPPPTSTVEHASQSTTTLASEGSSAHHSSVISSAVSGSDHSRTATITKPPASASASPLPTGITTNGVLNSSTLLNTTVPAGQLPFQPELTAGWGVSGVLLIVSGVIYTLVGIKNKHVHTFLSTAYLTSLAVAVLIVYVMHVPVTESLQGAYVAGTLFPGVALGAVALFFQELTEGLGCALGGFCISMWLLCLVPGGLLANVAGKVILIACFTLVAFAFYFSRITRDWALITMISFAGATVTVLGVDCFTRAGLKEFWAYVWHLNDELFPLGVDTFPVTKGIRVETAGIVIVTIFGIISQAKLWRVVREKRAKKAADQAEAQRALDEEEGNLGREVEQNNDRELRQWERVFGNGEVGSSTTSRESYPGDAEKKMRHSHADSFKPRGSIEVIEMADMAETSQSAGHDTLMATGAAEDGKVTVRVATDDVVEMGEEGNEGVDEKDAQEKSFDNEIATRTNRLSSSRRVSEPPEIVPLPFRVPAENPPMSPSERSSIATFADEDGLASPTSPTRLERAKRISRNSMSMLRSLSQRSRHSSREHRLEHGESSEDLVIPHHDRDENGSVAATMDGESVSGSSRRNSFEHEDSKSMEIKAELSDEISKDSPVLSQYAAANSQKPSQSQAAANHMVTDEVSKQPVEVDDSASQAAAQADGTQRKAEGQLVSTPEQPEQPQSIASVSSVPASLTQDRLPKSLSRVAMSYRTNEWAKHLSKADTPTPDELNIAETARQSTRVAKEKTAPVNVEDLQRTASDARSSHAAPVRRSDSQSSAQLQDQAMFRRGSKQRLSASMSMPLQSLDDDNSSNRGGEIKALRSVSSNSALRRTSSAAFGPIAEETNTSFADSSIPEESEDAATREASPPLSTLGDASRPPVPGVVSYASPQTLIGQREMFLRNKSQGNLLSNLPEPSNASQVALSDVDSINNYPAYAAALGVVDADDMPLNQRKQFMRQGSMMSLSHGNGRGTSITSSTSNLVRSPSGYDVSESGRHESYQTRQRVTSNVPPPAVREAQLANFRQSVANDLRAGSPMMTPSGRETPFSSTLSLLGSGRDAEVSRNIEMQRSMLLGQKEAEAHRRESQMREKEWADKAFDQRMRSGDLMEAHKEAMKKMQRGAKK